MIETKENWTEMENTRKKSIVSRIFGFIGLVFFYSVVGVLACVMLLCCVHCVGSLICRRMGV